MRTEAQATRNDGAATVPGQATENGCRFHSYTRRTGWQLSDDTLHIH